MCYTPFFYKVNGSESQSSGEARTNVSEEDKSISQAHCTSYLKESQYYSWYNTEQITEWPFAQISFENFPIICYKEHSVIRMKDGIGHTH